MTHEEKAKAEFDRIADIYIPGDCIECGEETDRRWFSICKECFVLDYVCVMSDEATERFANNFNRKLKTL